jgi:excinuclease ABC subunit C
MENAEHAFAEKQRATEDMDERLARIQNKLRLPTIPRRIECCDISHLGGEDTVGGVVALLDGKPDKARYRTYKVRTAGPGDDYAAMFEVLSRRFARGAKASEGVDADAWDLPDLFVVDGGRGQLAVALTAAHDLGLHELCIVGLAKERESPTGEDIVDRVYLPGQKNPIALRPNSPELYLLALARDEAHRFSNKGRKKVGKRRRFASRLDEIPSIGPKTRTALLTALGSVEGIRRATDEAVLAVKGVNKRHLEVLRKYLGREGEDEDDGVVEDAQEGQDSADGAEPSSNTEVAASAENGSPAGTNSERTPDEAASDVDASADDAGAGPQAR